MKTLLPMRSLFLATLLLGALCSFAQIDPAKVTIARDSFGVPHIFAKTDAEVAYGLAWAHAEDDFESIQLLLLPTKGLLGKHLGKAGAQADYVTELLRCRELVDEKWNTLSPDFVALVNGYVQGLNDYAKQHPKEVFVKKSFPVDAKNYMTAVVLAVAVFNGVDREISRIYNGRTPAVADWEIKGSNAIAVHPSKTTSGEAFLTINAHQPNEGTQAFYEAHVNSEEGWNALGGLLPGGCVVLHGTNENLGWAHTVNNPDKVDVYQLKMNPENPKQYELDGKWVDLGNKDVKLKVKGIPVKVKRKAFKSEYGPTIKTDKGVFAIRMSSLMDIRVMEQWYRMNKARNFTEFYQALNMHALSMFNILYADKNDTIFYVSNATLPDRNIAPDCNWRATLPGNTTRTLWTKTKPYSSLPQYINPKSGYLFNTNHSPFMATAPADNLDPKNFDPKDGFELFDNNRSARFKEMMPLENKLSYADMKRIKFSHQLPNKLLYSYDVEAMYAIKANEHTELAAVINDFQQWDKNATIDSKGAGAFLMAYYYLADSGAGKFKVYRDLALKTFAHVKNHQQKYFGKTGVTLGEYQQLVRGNKALPVWGMPDVLTAMWSAPTRNGRRKVVGGDGYIAFVRYPKNGLPIIESINCYGASAKKDSPHYNDQMERFIAQQTKPMTLDKAEVMRTAKRIYQPGK